MPGSHFALAAVVAAVGCCNGQTTEGMITGHVRDALTGAPIPGAAVDYEQLETNTHGTRYSSADGNYYIALLPPGPYRIRVNSPPRAGAGREPYQARELYAVQLSVAGYVHVDFDLRPLSDVWERGRYRSYVFRNNTVVPFYGPDVDPSYIGDFEPERRTGGQLEPSMSAVIDPAAIASLPLAGRDVYAALVLLPGVTAESTTTRSLGLSANGQRPSSSNFLLDGLEDNDSLLSGPGIQLAPEMVQEYRVSTNNFSAEYGRTDGYIANAATRSATSAWHGIGYGDLNNQALNANTFEHNSKRLRRATVHQIEAGVSAGGVIPHSRLYTWLAYDRFGSRGYSDPTTYVLPTLSFASSLPVGSRVRKLLQDHPPGQWADSSFGNQGPVRFDPPVTLRRSTALERLDYALTPSQHFMARVAGDLLSRPDFNWSPYGQAPLSQQSVDAAVTVSSSWSPALVSEIRASFLSNYRSWDLALAGLPQLGGLGNLLLPGACCTVDRIQDGWRDRRHSFEVSSQFVFTSGPHVFKFGAGVLRAENHTAFKIPPGGEFAFASLTDLAGERPYLFGTTLSRLALQNGTYQQPDTNRQYGSDQPYAFAQEDWRISARLTLNAGLRYDRFPAPTNTGSVPDVLVVPGAGATFGEQVAAARVADHRGALFSTHANYWSVRLAFSAALWKKRGTVLRGGFGTFHDRPFDNLFLTASANDLSSIAFTRNSCPVATVFASPQNISAIAKCPAQAAARTLFDLTMFEPGLRSPLVQSFFLSLQQPLGRSISLELNGAGSRGRQLLTTDIVNRSAPFFLPGNGLPDIDYRTNQGFSDYAALSFTLRYRSGPVTLNSAYTWSHSIDNQSDPLLGEYFDFGFSNQTDRTGQNYLGAFTFPGDTRIDRGNSDFDQRQNFVGWATWALPHPANGRMRLLLSDWTGSFVFALRSGLPYSVYAGATNCFPVCNTRANVVDQARARVRAAVPGGVQLLDPSAFSVPAPGQEGNSGRNSFAGPGFGNLDLSIARSFKVRDLGENTRITLRADAFNILNHPNLQNPEAYLGYQPGLLSPEFGIALYGRAAAKNGFPALTPLTENARQVHVLLRFEF